MEIVIETTKALRARLTILLVEQNARSQGRRG